MIFDMIKRVYCLGLVLGCMLYCIAVVGVIYAPAVWVVYRVMSR